MWSRLKFKTSAAYGLVYAVEVWTIKEDIVKNLERPQLWFRIRMVRISRVEHVTNQRVLRKRSANHCQIHKNVISGAFTPYFERQNRRAPRSRQEENIMPQKYSRLFKHFLIKHFWLNSCLNIEKVCRVCEYRRALSMLIANIRARYIKEEIWTGEPEKID